MKTFNGTYVSIETVKTGLIQVGAIDIHNRERMIYWSDHALRTINRMNANTGSAEVKIWLLG